MTEQQVTAAVGQSVDKVELKTCGTQSQAGAWQCKIMSFSVLHVYLAADNKGVWRTNGWQVGGF
jgi:hypothetical protein